LSDSLAAVAGPPMLALEPRIRAFLERPSAPPIDTSTSQCTATMMVRKPIIHQHV